MARHTTHRPALRKLAAALAVALATGAAPAFGLDLLQSYELALSNDAQLRAARARAEAGREQVPQAIAGLLPNVGANYSRGEVDQDRTSSGVTQSLRYPTDSLTVQVVQPLYRKAGFARLDEARAQVAGSEATLERDTQDMGSRVVAAYFDALFQRDRLRLTQAQIANTDAQLRSARMALAAGTGTRTDIDELQARLDVLQADQIQVLQAIDASSQQLQVFIGQPVEALATIREQTLSLDAFEPGELTAWQDRALESSPEIRALEARTKQAQAAVDVARSGHHPTLDMVIRYSDSRSDTPALVGPGGFDIKSTFVGVQAQLPLYAGGRVNSEVREALARADEAREQLAFSRQDIGVKVRREHNAVREGIARVRALERALASAEQVVTSNRKGVQAGTRTTLDVLKVEQDLFNTQVELARARYNLLVAWGRLNGLAGSLDSSEVGRINGVLASNDGTVPTAE